MESGRSPLLLRQNCPYPGCRGVNFHDERLIRIRWTRIGALTKASFKVLKASVADGVQDSDLGLSLRRLVSGLAMEL